MVRGRAAVYIDRITVGVDDNAAHPVVVDVAVGERDSPCDHEPRSRRAAGRIEHPSHNHRCTELSRRIIANHVHGPILVKGHPQRSIEPMVRRLIRCHEAGSITRTQVDAFDDAIILEDIKIAGSGVSPDSYRLAGNKSESLNGYIRSFWQRLGGEEGRGTDHTTKQQKTGSPIHRGTHSIFSDRLKDFSDMRWEETIRIELKPRLGHPFKSWYATSIII